MNTTPRRSKQKIINVLIADDHAVVREGIRKLLNGSDRIKIAGEAENGLQAIAMTGELRPDIILMDASMPEMNGIVATKKIRRKYSSVKIIMLSMYATPDYIIPSIKAGASGYLIKTSCSKEIMEAIYTVHDGGRYFKGQIAESLINEFILGLNSRKPAEKQPFDRLSHREKQVLDFVMKGHTFTEIADFLKISPKTVTTYRYRIMQKVNVPNIASLIKLALQHGLCDDLTPYKPAI